MAGKIEGGSRNSEKNNQNLTSPVQEANAKPVYESPFERAFPTPGYVSAEITRGFRPALEREIAKTKAGNISTKTHK